MRKSDDVLPGYVLKNRRTNDVCFVVVFTLLFGQELRDALRSSADDAPTPTDTTTTDSVPSNSSRSQSLQTDGGAEADDGDDDKCRGARNPSSSSSSSESSSISAPDAAQTQGYLASLGRWVPKLLRSGGTATGGSSTPTPTPSEQSGSGSRQASLDERVERLEDGKVEEALRERYASTAGAKAEAER
jgi:hypothetical protein